MSLIHLLTLIVLVAIPATLAITVHEVAHGAVARHFGDDTAWYQGRLTLNPLAHIDPVGTIAVPLLVLALSALLLGVPFAFGWAKPVPVVPRNLRNPRRHLAWVAAAGPAANLIMACGWVLFLKLLLLLKSGGVGVPDSLALMGEIGIVINLVVGLFNLLPIPPMDGSRILSSLLPAPAGQFFDRIGRYRIVLVAIIVLLLATGSLTTLLMPPLKFSAHLIEQIAGVNLKYF